MATRLRAARRINPADATSSSSERTEEEEDCQGVQEPELEQSSSRRSRSSAQRGPARKERLPGPFRDHRTELKEYLLHFETVAIWNGWDYAERGHNLAMCLRGAAQQVLSELPPEEQLDYESTIEAL